MERRLTAILAADVVGYSRLMGSDEAGTLAALKAVRSDLIDGKIAEQLSSERVTSANVIGGKWSLSPILPIKVLKRSVPFFCTRSLINHSLSAGRAYN